MSSEHLCSKPGWMRRDAGEVTQKSWYRNTISVDIQERKNAELMIRKLFNSPVVGGRKNADEIRKTLKISKANRNLGTSLQRRKGELQECSRQEKLQLQDSVLPVSKQGRTKG